MSYYRHTHQVVGIDVAWKPECVTIECHCGKKYGIGLWYSSPPKGWAKTGWDKVIQSARILHDNWYKQLGRFHRAQQTWVRAHEPSP